MVAVEEMVLVQNLVLVQMVVVPVADNPHLCHYQKGVGEMALWEVCSDNHLPANLYPNVIHRRECL